VSRGPEHAPFVVTTLRMANTRSDSSTQQM